MEYVEEKNGSGRIVRRAAIRVSCKNCGDIYLHSKRRAGRDDERFCSVKCSAEFRAKKSRVTLVCGMCGVEFTRAKSKVKSSRSGIHFCSRSCKDSGQRLSSGISEIHPSHYGNGDYAYRLAAMSRYKKECACCGWDDDERILEVHHIDGDRKNNDIYNLIVMCPTCHRKVTLGYYGLVVEGHGTARGGHLVCTEEVSRVRFPDGPKG